MKGCIALMITVLLVAGNEEVHGQVAFGTRHPVQFDINKDVIIYHIIAKFDPPFRAAVSRYAMDVTLVLRYTTMLSHAWFDVWTAYHDTAKGITHNLPRLPAHIRTLRNKNTSLLYASYRILLGFMPKEYHQQITDIVKSYGMDTALYYEDEETPVGIGNLVGNNVVRLHYGDGMNQLGEDCDRKYHKVNYSDCVTGYKPVNSGYQLVDHTKWQPAVLVAGYGRFVEQHFVTPQYGLSQTYLVPDVNVFSVQPHRRLNPDTYKVDVDEVLNASASLTDEQKMMAELFDDKGKGLFSAVAHVLFKNGIPDLDTFVAVELMTNVALYDVMIVVWKEKAKHDAVRPFSAIRHVYGNNTVKSWGGPGVGTVEDLKASDWTSYMPVADHPEYPSGTTAACSVQAEAMRAYTGTDDLNWTVDFEKGSSRIEPGITPQQNISVTFKTWTEYETACGLSRLYGGVHFTDSIEAIKDVAHQVGRMAAEYIRNHVNP